MKVVIERGTCLCAHQQHRIELREDGSVECSDHPGAVEQGKRMAAFARLGRPVEVQGCATIAAIVHGAEILCDSAPNSLPTPWRGAMNTYGSNAVVQSAMRAAIVRKQIAHEKTAHRLMLELNKCDWFRDPARSALSLQVVTGLSGDEVRNWDAVVRGATLRIPLQAYWLDLAENGQVVYQNKLVVGESDDPRVVYAVFLDHDSPSGPTLRVGSFRRDSRAKTLGQL